MALKTVVDGHKSNIRYTANVEIEVRSPFIHIFIFLLTLSFCGYIPTATIVAILIWLTIWTRQLFCFNIQLSNRIYTIGFSFP